MFAFILFIAVFSSNSAGSSDITVDHSSIVATVEKDMDALPATSPKVPDYDEDRLVSNIFGFSPSGDHLLSLLTVNQNEHIKYLICQTVYQSVRQKEKKQLSLYYDFSPDADTYLSIS
jgi:hypothetical protein